MTVRTEAIGTDSHVREPARLYELDLLRLAAALMVVCHHYFGSANARNRYSLALGDVFTYGPIVEEFAALGVLGVDVFFIISGFVIALSAQHRSSKEFLLSRASRILPAFLFCCVLTWSALWLDGEYRNVTVWQLVANLLFVASPLGFQFVDGVYWSLVIEIRFYLLVLIIIALGWFQKYHWLLLVWLVISVVDAVHPIPRVLRVVLLPQFAHYFIAGGALFLIYVGSYKKIAYSLLVGSVLLSLYRVYDKTNLVQPNVSLLSVVVILSAVGVLWAIATRNSAFVGRSWMVRMGTLTYPLYLLHQDLGFLFIRHFPWGMSAGLITLLAIGCFLLLSFFLHRYVERPASSWMRRFSPYKRVQSLVPHI